MKEENPSVLRKSKEIPVVTGDGSSENQIHRPILYDLYESWDMKSSLYISKERILIFNISEK